MDGALIRGQKVVASAAMKDMYACSSLGSLVSSSGDASGAGARLKVSAAEAGSFAKMQRL